MNWFGKDKEQGEKFTMSVASADGVGALGTGPGNVDQTAQRDGSFVSSSNVADETRSAAMTQKNRPFVQSSDLGLDPDDLDGLDMDGDEAVIDGRNPNRRKRIAAAVAVIVLALGILGGTFAWNNYLQHKSNDASLGGLFYKAVLVENYDPVKAANWQIEDPTLTKQISVLNPGAVNAGDPYTYGDVYARIQLKEFMEFYPVSQTMSTVRYMIDTAGKFIAFDPTLNYDVTVDANGYPSYTVDTGGGGEPGGQAVIDYANALGAKYGNGAHTVVQDRQFFTPIKTNSVAANPAVAAAHPDWIDTTDPTIFNTDLCPVDGINGVDDADLPWYIETQAGDPNGVYGAFLTTDSEINYAAGTSLVPGVVRASDDQTTNQNDAINTYDDLTSGGMTTDPAAPTDNGECLYTPHQWTQGMYKWEVNGAGNPSFFDYVAWVYGSNVILYSQWNGQPVNKWIIDDRPTGNDQGWVYWGNAIEPGEQTSDFLEAMTLIAQPSDKAYYAVHVDMQAVSYDELDRWSATNDTSGNDAIVAALEQAGQKVTGVTILTTPTTVSRGKTTDFAAIVQGSNGIVQNVTWSIDKTDGGSSITSIDPTTGRLTVGLGETNDTLTIKATSTADPTKSATWTVDVVTTPIVTGVVLLGPADNSVQMMDPTTFVGTEQFQIGSENGSGVQYTVTGANGYTIKDPNTMITQSGVLTVGPTETVGAQLTVTATSKTPDYTDQSASVTVTIYPQLTATPTIATTRYIPAAAAGDTSDWVEIATNGKYSLMVRKDPIQPDITGFSAAQATPYDGSLQQTAINSWFAGNTDLSATAPLRSVTVANTAMDELGNALDRLDRNVGFSAPAAEAGATGTNTAFALSFAEAYNFAGTGSTVWNDPQVTVINSYNDNPTGTINYQYLAGDSGYSGTVIALLRAPGLTGYSGYALSWSSDMSLNGFVNTGFGQTTGRTFVAQPAVWIDTAAAQAQGLLVDRYPTVATTRYITAAAAGDTSDWEEIATYSNDGHNYSLMLRQEALPDVLKPVALSDSVYQGSKQQNAINDWFASTTDLEANAPLRSLITGNTAMDNLGNYSNSNTGFSLPSGAAGATGANTAFALSTGETVRFLATSFYYYAPTRSTNAYNNEAQPNSDFLMTNVGASDVYIMLLRTGSDVTDRNFCYFVYSNIHSFHTTNYSLNAVNTDIPVAQPAVWIDADAAQADGLFTNR